MHHRGGGDDGKGTCLISLSREVVGRLEGAGDALLDGSIATVVGAEDGVLEASRVLELDVELAVLALLGDGNGGANGGNVCVEDDSDERLVGGKLGAQGALRTSGSAIGDTANGDLGFV